ncbi:2-amino-4-hydroxy-6-hydroxymethyldihydropteridine diphosphokinase [Bosea sp. (in: a-proteobacteria)]|uniref:2-amino-4-hydroxy-6- hydroxymethyldihydropteridine diphosphokinase n=1 Tax=Bosea sp. (in: a-proteobacteria) TaxID=1871050 RepID=UPI0026337F27|nr:2-amino-4-hydroxy-6-hydroxymethyldihydropteridine diphosphokinase [Bosea sp. (in: a-proteobacteria)]MCO5090717.1 2-amino-4-hydroxy-6-hydroxymethyldihydropteridine diphosphokinase [Bosea sp. (in: a-proteobacteria)]
MAIEAALAFGGNIGDPVAAFAAALKSLRDDPAVRLGPLSSIYRTPPWGKTDQPEFLNMAALVETTLTADELLALCLALERAGGRERRERWGPRTLDIDILTYGEAAIDRPGLQIPHPRLAARAFVLAPLAQILPRHRIGGTSVADLLAAAAEETIRRDEAATARLGELLAG